MDRTLEIDQFFVLDPTGRIPGEEVVREYNYDPKKCVIVLDIMGCLKIRQEGRESLVFGPETWGEIK